MSLSDEFYTKLGKAVFENEKSCTCHNYNLCILIRDEVMDGNRLTSDESSSYESLICKKYPNLCILSNKEGDKE